VREKINEDIKDVEFVEYVLKVKLCLLSCNIVLGLYLKNIGYFILLQIF